MTSKNDYLHLILVVIKHVVYYLDLILVVSKHLVYYLDLVMFTDLIFQVCRHYLVKFCPHDLFTNTKSDLGPCEKVRSIVNVCCHIHIECHTCNCIMYVISCHFYFIFLFSFKCFYI